MTPTVHVYAMFMSSKSITRLAIRPQKQAPLRTVARRSFADGIRTQLGSATSQRPVTAIKRKEDAVRVAKSKQFQNEQLKSGHHLLVFGVLLIAIPPISYYYYQYRSQHMKEKKEAILKDIQARAAQRG